MRIVFLFAALVVFFQTTAQVRDVKSNIEKDKASDPGFSKARSETSDWDPPEFEDGLAAFLVGGLVYYTFYGAYRGLDYGQSVMQERRYNYPETFSLQGDILGGFDFGDDVLLVSPSLRGNWGLFASDLRYQRIDDATGDLKLLDWQVLILRFPLQNFKLEYGIGFSHVFSPSKTYFDQSAGFDWCLFNCKATLQGQYRWSQDTSLGDRFRQEFNISAGYETGRLGKLRFSPTIGFAYQDFFGTTQFRFFQLGLKIRWF